MEQKDLSYIKKLAPVHTEILEQLVPYSNKTTRIKQIESLQFFSSQLEFVQKNETVLDVNESYDLKRYQTDNNEAWGNSVKWGLLTGWAFFTYYVVKTPPGRTLYPEILKSMFFGGAVSSNYKMYYNMQYRKRVYTYFDLIIERKLNKAKLHLNQSITASE